MLRTVRAAVQLARPAQWVKNIFADLAFAQQVEIAAVGWIPHPSHCHPRIRPPYHWSKWPHGCLFLVWCSLGPLAGCVTVHVESEPAGAKAYLNGREIGTTPFTRTFGLFEGANATMAAVLPGFKLEECAPKPGPAPGNVAWITTAPPGANIYKDGVPIGTSPMYDVPTIPSSFRVVWSQKNSAENDTSRSDRADSAKASEGPQIVAPSCKLGDLPPVQRAASAAILDFQVGEGITRDVGLALADVCREAVQDSGRYVLVDRESMKAILSEEDFAATFQCDDTRCLVNFGRKLQAQKIIYGRISRLGQAHLLTVKMIDVASSEVEAIKTSKIIGDADVIVDFVRPSTCELLRDAIQSQIRRAG